MVYWICLTVRREGGGFVGGGGEKDRVAAGGGAEAEWEPYHGVPPGRYWPEGGGEAGRGQQARQPSVDASASGKVRLG